MHLIDLNNIAGMDSLGREPSRTSSLQLSSSPPESWLHSPPSQMPWGVSQPSLVRFTAELPLNGVTTGGDSRYVPQGCMPQAPSSFTQTLPTFSQTSSLNSMSTSIFPVMTQTMSSSSCNLKRKLNTADDADMLCAVNKLHISEDRMTSHQQGVHALSQLANAALGNVSDITEGKRLVISEEVQQFPIEEPILPQPLLDRMRRPSNALVLWQPPRSLTSSLPAASTSEEEDDTDNNNSSTLDLNNLPCFSYFDGPTTPPPQLQDEEDIEMEAL